MEYVQNWKSCIGLGLIAIFCSLVPACMVGPLGGQEADDEGEVSAAELKETDELVSFFETPLIPPPDYDPSESQNVPAAQFQAPSIPLNFDVEQIGTRIEPTGVPPVARMRIEPKNLRNRTLSIFGGWSFVDPQLRFGSNSFFRSDSVSDGYTAGFATGRRLGTRFRTELEFSYRRNELSNNFFVVGFAPISFLPPFGQVSRGELHTYSGMANFYFDFDRSPDRKLTPYVGVGIGASYIDSDVTYRGSGETPSNESTFAFQAIGGVSARLSSCADLFVEYRYFRTGKDDFYLPDTAGPFNQFVSDKFDFFHEDSSLLMGLRFKY